MQTSERQNIAGLFIHHIRFESAIKLVTDLAKKRIPSFVCFVNAHMTVEAYKSKPFAQRLKEAVLLLPDGAPIAKAFGLLYKKKQERIAGMDFMPALIRHLNNQPEQFRIFLLGSTMEILNAIEIKIKTEYPNLQLVGMYSPPFRDLIPEELQEINKTINQSGAEVVFVSLGCPKQEKWMAANYRFINAVLLGVGGAFPVFAGLQQRAPLWMQFLLLEWLYRLLKEPSRLWKRYFYTNTVFIYLLFKQLISNKKRRHEV